MSESTVPEGTPSDPLHAAAEEIRAQHPEFDEVPLLEDDETVPPRPEEIVADADRA